MHTALQTYSGGNQRVGKCYLWLSSTLCTLADVPLSCFRSLMLASRRFLWSNMSITSLFRSTYWPCSLRYRSAKPWFIANSDCSVSCQLDNHNILMNYSYTLFSVTACNVEVNVLVQSYLLSLMFLCSLIAINFDYCKYLVKQGRCPFPCSEVLQNLKFWSSSSRLLTNFKTLWRVLKEVL